MKSFLLVLILLVSFLSANAAELSCLCTEDTTTHSQEGKTTIEKSVHHSDQEAESDHQDHCQHICMQCHLAAVVPSSFILKFDSVGIYTSYIILDQIPHEFGQSLYRPPIS